MPCGYEIPGIRQLKNIGVNMFRELSRIKKKITDNECIELLKAEKRGILSVNGDNGYPYGMPMNHFYCEENGKIYFHCGKSGHRTDSLKNSDKVSFCVLNSGVLKGGWALNIKSVIVFGRIRVVDDPEKTADITAHLSRKFTDDEEYIKKEISTYLKATALLELTVEHICGKEVEES